MTGVRPVYPQLSSGEIINLIVSSPTWTYMSPLNIICMETFSVEKIYTFSIYFFSSKCWIPTYKVHLRNNKAKVMKQNSDTS